MNKNKIMDYLGTYRIRPNINEIEVDCYGIIITAQSYGLEQQGFSSHCELEKVEDSGIDITDYLSSGLFDYLNDKINESHK
jgi:hypothetical protein